MKKTWRFKNIFLKTKYTNKNEKGYNERKYKRKEIETENKMERKTSKKENRESRKTR